ncbi:MAG: rhomboid family intramembrane serine protease, partial [Limisphaerales bacterium]
MLDDRYYMRQNAFRPQRSATVILLVVNLLIYLFQEIHARSLHLPMGTYIASSPFALSLEDLRKGYVWQLISFQFMHAGWLHLLGNSLFIYFFGRAIEDTFGRKEFLKLYFISGMAGGLFQMLFAWLLPEQFGQPVVGASAGAAGLVGAFALMFPERSLTFVVFYVIPVSLRAKTFLWITIGLAVFGMFSPNQIAHAAHLGGIFVGIIYVIYFVKGNGFSFLKWRSSPRPILVPRELVQTHSSRSQWRRPQKTDPEKLPSAEFINRQV